MHFLLLFASCLSAVVTLSEAEQKSENENTINGKLRTHLNKEIIELSALRPMTPVEGIDERGLKPFRVIPGQTPCVYKKYVNIFQEAEIMQESVTNLLLEATITLKNQDFYLYDAEDLCMDVADDLTIDVFKYDCTHSGLCSCGRYYGYVDPNVLQPETRNKLRRYVAVHGLDRHLVDEEGECVSGPRGHCSLTDSKSQIKLECGGTMDCVLDDAYGPILTNKLTNETYGVCIQKPSKAPPGENMIAYDKILYGGGPPSTTTSSPTGYKTLGLLLFLELMIVLRVWEVVLCAR